mgnify:CR=1 FL=1
MKKQKERGITLIALVITIIVLLMLAGVSISMISSQDGILNKATGAKEKMNKAEAVEQVQLAVMASYNDEGQIDYEKLKTELNKIKEITPITEEITSLPFVVNINGKKIKIMSNGTAERYLDVSIELVDNSYYRLNALSIKVNIDNVIQGDVTYKYYIKLASDTDDKYILEKEGTENAYEYTGLSDSTSYMMKVEAIDKDGAKGEATITAGTLCFVAGTQVLTEDGMKNIEDIEIGQRVYAINTDTNERELKEVTNIFRGTSDELYRLKIGDEIVSATPKHQFYIVDKGWVRAYDLKEGDKIVSKETQDLVIEKIEHEKLENPVKVYNLTIEGHHNYLITKYELLVHNARSITQ